MSSSNNQQQQQQDALACEIHEADLQNFKGMNPDDNIIMLDFRRNNIHTFYGIPTLNNVQCMRFDDNNLSSFLGMSFQPKLQVLTLLGNPITRNPNYRVLALLACGPSLREIDGALVTSSERQQYEKCGGCEGLLAQMVSLGWMSLEMGRIEGIKAEFLRYVNSRVHDAGSFGVIAPEVAEVVPLAAEPATATTTTTKRSLVTTGGSTYDRYEEQEQQGTTTRNDHAVGYSTQTGEAIMGRDRGSLDFSQYDESTAAQRQSNPQHHQLTSHDVKYLLQGTREPNFGIGSSSTSVSNSRDQSRYGATTLINQSRAKQIFSVMQQERDSTTTATSNHHNDGTSSSSDGNNDPVALARQYVKAYSKVQQQPQHHEVVVSNYPLSSVSNSAGPSPMSPMNASPINNNNRSTHHHQQQHSATTQEQISTSQIPLSRSDILSLGAVELSYFDVSAQWQAPKSGSIQIVRGTLRIEFDYTNNIQNSSTNKKTATNPRLVVLDDTGRIVSEFPLPVSRADRHQSLWIHEGRPPAIALCSEPEEGGPAIDVVIMPSAEIVTTTSSNQQQSTSVSSSNLTRKAQTLHKLLAHAMVVAVDDEEGSGGEEATTVTPVRRSASKNNTTPGVDGASPSPVSPGHGGGIDEL